MKPIIKVSLKNQVDYGEKYKNLTSSEQKKVCDVLYQMIDETTSEIDTVVIPLGGNYLSITHLLDTDFYNMSDMSKLEEQIRNSYFHTNIRAKKNMLHVFVTPLKYSEPVSEEQDLSELFTLSTGDKSIEQLISLLTDLDMNKISSLKKVDTILYKYNCTSSNDMMVVRFNDEFLDSSKEFYIDLIKILRKNIEHVKTVS